MKLILEDLFYGLGVLLLAYPIHCTPTSVTKSTTTHTSNCYVVQTFTYDKLIHRENQKTTWLNICANGSYLVAAWAEFSTEHFQKWKCCYGDAIESWSWEIRDLSFMPAGVSIAKEPWKVQCPENTVITGFRYIDGKNNLRYLTSVRCSLLKYKSTDQQNCHVLDFSKSVNIIQNETIGDATWGHECKYGFAMVALYDNNMFKNIQKAKCCKINDFNFKVGFLKNTFPNYGGLSRWKDNQIEFTTDDQGSEINVRVPSYNFTDYSLGRLITPGFQNASFCLKMIIQSFLPGNKLSIKLVTEDTVDALYEKYLSINKFTYKVYIKSRPNVNSQLYIDFMVKTGLFYLTSIEVSNKTTCDVDWCNKDQLESCDQNEECVKQDGKFKCNCPTQRNFEKKNGFCGCIPGFTNNETGWCVNTTDISKGSGKNNLFTDYTITGEPTVVTTIPVVIKNSMNNTITKPWVYILAGSISSIVVVAIIVGGKMMYHRSRKKKRRNSFLFRLQDLDQHQMYNHRSCSMQTMTTVSNTQLYRPYMPDLGIVENLPTSQRNSLAEPSPVISEMDKFLYHSQQKSSVDPSTTIYPNTSQYIFEMTQQIEEECVNDPIYSSINRCVDADPDLDSNGNMISMGNVNIRRGSYITLMQPVYGNDDEESGDQCKSEEDEIDKFLVPGDDEEELINDLKELTPDQVTISQKILGQGAFGLVKLGEMSSSHDTMQVAIKILKQKKNDLITQQDRITFYQEAAIMSQFYHQNVVTLYGVIVGPQPCMVTEYMERGNLWKYLNRVRRIRKKENVQTISRQLHAIFLKMARDIVSGMVYLAGLNFVHRDLASRNIFMDNERNCKIGDFGLSRHFLKDDTCYTSRGGKIPIKWTAPEALKFKKYSSLSDVWSYGVVLWEIWSLGKRPYDGINNDQIIDKVCEKGYRLGAPDQVPVMLYRMMMDCWKHNMDDRPTFQQLKFCLDHSDDQILGRMKKKAERTRSITFSHYSDNFSDHEHNTSDPQNYCRSE